jgi:hypothetical protein
MLRRENKRARSKVIVVVMMQLWDVCHMQRRRETGNTSHQLESTTAITLVGSGYVIDVGWVTSRVVSSSRFMSTISS